MTRLLLAFLFLFVFPAQALTGIVVHVADGDTITVLSNHLQYRVRLHGIDAPEKRQPFGMKSKEYASGLAFGKTVTVTEHAHDRYGRIVGDVTLPDGRDMEHEMVLGGYAWWAWKYAAHDAALAALENTARETRSGLWAEPDPVAPWEFRHRR